MRPRNDEFYVLPIQDVDKCMENNREILSIVISLQKEFDYLVNDKRLLSGEYRLYCKLLKRMNALLADGVTKKN